jgi:hypothetical protein
MTLACGDVLLSLRQNLDELRLIHDQTALDEFDLAQGGFSTGEIVFKSALILPLRSFA